MDRLSAQDVVIKRRKRKRMGRSGPTKSGVARQPQETMSDRFRMEQRRRLMNKTRDNLPGGMLTGGQAKIAAKAPPTNKIDGKDFAVLRAEKAKGRGQGLQDEKMKPGKVMKADKGGMGKAEGYKKYLKGLKKAEGEQFRSKFKAKELAKAGGKAAMRAAKASKIGKIAAGVAAVGLGAKAFLNKKLKEAKENKKMGGGMMMQKPMGNYMGGGLTEATQRLKAQGKMGGGMMMRPVPVGMKSGKSVKVKCKLGRNKPTKMY